MNYFFTNNICIFTMIETYFKNIQISQIHSKRLNSKKNCFFPCNISTVSTIIKSKPQQKKTPAQIKSNSHAPFFFLFYLPTKTRRKGLKLILDVCILYSRYPCLRGNGNERSTDQSNDMILVRYTVQLINVYTTKHEFQRTLAHTNNDLKLPL